MTNKEEMFNCIYDYLVRVGKRSGYWHCWDFYLDDFFCVSAYIPINQLDSGIERCLYFNDKRRDAFSYIWDEGSELGGGALETFEALYNLIKDNNKFTRAIRT